MTSDQGSNFAFEINGNDDGERFDILAASRLKDVSRSRISSLIKSGFIVVNSEIKKPGYHVSEGDMVTGFLPFARECSCEPEDIKLDVVFEDSHLVIINKPAGMVVHPAPGHPSGTLVNALLAHCPDLQGIGGELRPGIVHRLDKDTTGLMIAAKNQLAHAALVELFKSRCIEKRYMALIVGNLKANSGVIDLPIGRHQIDRKKMSVQSRNARCAETGWRVIERFDCATLVEASIKTGRTHQIRVHFDAIGFPLAGDQTYGLKKNAWLMRQFAEEKIPGRQMLHSCYLKFKHPATDRILEFASDLPEDMSAFIEQLKLRKK